MPNYTTVIIDDRYSSHQIEIDILARAGSTVTEIRDRNPRREEVIEACRTADALIVNLYPIDAGLIDHLERCKIIVRYGVGYDSIDVVAATTRNIRVANVPDYCSEEVSDQAMALFFDCVRQVSYRDAKIRYGVWDAPDCGSIRRISGRRFGLVGYGQIARTLHRKLSGFGLAEVLIHDPFLPENFSLPPQSRIVVFETLLKNADFISLHVPLTENTRGLFGAEEFRSMKRDAILINTSRGGLIDTAALAAALVEGEIGWAGLDVHEIEPVPADYPLLKMPNIVLSDHRGFFSVEAQAELQRKAAESAAEMLMGREPASVVNQPSV